MALTLRQRRGLQPYTAGLDTGDTIWKRLVKRERAEARRARLTRLRRAVVAAWLMVAPYGCAVFIVITLAAAQVIDHRDQAITRLTNERDTLASNNSSGSLAPSQHQPNSKRVASR